MASRHPSLVCKFAVKDWNDVTEDVASRTFDIGLADITEASKKPDLETEVLRVSPITVFCRAEHPLAQKSQVTLTDILEFPWAGPALPATMFAALPKQSRPFGIVDNTTHRVIPRIWVETFSAAKNIVLSGNALSAGPRHLIERELAESTLAVLPVESAVDEAELRLHLAARAKPVSGLPCLHADRA